MSDDEVSEAESDCASEFLYVAGWPVWVTSRRSSRLDIVHFLALYSRAPRRPLKFRKIDVAQRDKESS